MVKRFKPTAGFIAVVLIVLSLLIIGIIMYRNELKMSEASNVDFARLPEPVKLSHNDSLPYYQYREIEDSLKHVSDTEKEKNTIHPNGFPSTLGFFGYLRTFRTWYGWYTDNKSHMIFDYHIWLPAYSLDDGYEFQYKDGKNYLLRANGTSKEIKVAYLPEFQQSVLVPVSKDAFAVARVIIFSLTAIIGFALLYIFIGIPINILLNISRGRVFTMANMRSLNMLSYTALGFFIVQMIMPYVVGLFFRNQIPSELSLSFSSLLSSNWEMGLFGIITLAIARAFAKGYKLQQEQDLTI